MKDYKKILEGVVNIINTTEKSDIGFANICTYIGENCPELKESKDERIRKSILNYLTKMWGNSQDDVYGVNVEDVIAWLERQAKRNPADKAESKFKVGDWIVHQGTGYIYQVVAVINNYNKYVLKYRDNYTIQTCTDVDKRTRLWTIQDAKKGDVLVDYCDDLYNPLIFVLNKVQHVDFGLVKPSDCSSICYLRASKNQEFMLGYYHHLHNVKPATKEQIDLLFGKMKKEGYKLDANYNVVEI